MKIQIEGTQEEFDEKRFDILKALGGKKFNIESKPIQMRRAFFTAQNQMMDFWDEDFKKMMDGLKEDVVKIIDEKL